MEAHLDMEKDNLLKNFMEEQFCFDGLVEIGFFKEEMRGDYKAQAERVCKFFGYKTVYEYGAKEFRAHVTYGDPEDISGIGTSRPLHVNHEGKLKEEPFITVISSIYE